MLLLLEPERHAPSPAVFEGEAPSAWGRGRESIRGYREERTACRPQSCSPPGGPDGLIRLGHIHPADGCPDPDLVERESSRGAKVSPVYPPLTASSGGFVCLRRRYSVAFDPLDGSSIVDANFAVGSIFGVWPGDKLLGRTGKEQVRWCGQMAFLGESGPALSWESSQGCCTPTRRMAVIGSLLSRLL